MKKAVLNNQNVIETIIMADDNFTIEGKILVTAADNMKIGGTIIDNVYTDPITPDLTNEQVQNHISTYRDFKAINYPYNGIVMRLTDGARADLTAVYFVVQSDQTIPNDQVMMVWQEDNYDDLNITAGMLRADGLTFMAHRQKCFSAASSVRATHEQTPYTSVESIETAFDAAYNS